MELARAEYFKLANADDISAPTLVEKCVGVLDREPAVVLSYGQTTLIDGDGKVLRPYDDRLHLEQPRAVDRFDTALRRIASSTFSKGDADGRVTPDRMLGSYLGSDMVLVAELTLYGPLRRDSGAPVLSTDSCRCVQ